MSTDAKNKDDENRKDLRAWSDCDLFCIHDYAGSEHSPCGWRGRLADVTRDSTDGRLVCPRCGCATLFRIPLASSGL